MTVHSKLVFLASSVAIAQFAQRPQSSSLPQNLLDAQQQFREAQEKLKVAQNGDGEVGRPQGRALSSLISSLENNQELTTDRQLTDTVANKDEVEYANYDYNLDNYDYSETTEGGLSEEAMRRRKNKKKKKPKRPAAKGKGKGKLSQFFDYGELDISTQYQSTTPKNQAKKPSGMTASNDRSNNDPSAFDDKGQWVGGGQMTDYDYYNNKNTFNAKDNDNSIDQWDTDPLGNNDQDWGANSYANADLGVDYGFQVNPDMPSYDKNKKKHDRNQPGFGTSTSMQGTNNRATWDAWGECTPEKIAQNADLLDDEFDVLKLHNYGCWCTIIGEKRECLKGRPQDPIDTFCRDWLACRRCTLFAPHFCGRENLHNKDENAYGLEFFQNIIAGTFTCDHLTGDDCAYNRCLCDKEMGEQIMCKMDTFADVYVGVDPEDCPRQDDPDYCAPDSCCGDFPHVTPWSTTCHQCTNGTRTRL